MSERFCGESYNLPLIEVDVPVLHRRLDKDPYRFVVLLSSGHMKKYGLYGSECCDPTSPESEGATVLCSAPGQGTEA